MIPSWMVQLLTALVCILVILIWMFRLRSKYQRQAIDNVQFKAITEHGTSYKKLLPVVNGFVKLPGNKKRGTKDKMFPVAEVATYQIEYPEGFIPRFLRTTIREVIYREDTWEPIYNRGNPLLDPAMLNNVINQKFSEVGLAHSQSEAEAEKKLKEKLKPSTVYFLLYGIGVILIALGIFVVINLPAIKEILTKIAQALGV